MLGASLDVFALNVLYATPFLPSFKLHPQREFATRFSNETLEQLTTRLAHN